MQPNLTLDLRFLFCCIFPKAILFLWSQEIKSKGITKLVALTCLLSYWRLEVVLHTHPGLSDSSLVF